MLLSSYLLWSAGNFILLNGFMLTLRYLSRSVSSSLVVPYQWVPQFCCKYFEVCLLSSLAIKSSRILLEAAPLYLDLEKVKEDLLLVWLCVMNLDLLPKSIHIGSWCSRSPRLACLASFPIVWFLHMSSTSYLSCFPELYLHLYTSVSLSGPLSNNGRKQSSIYNIASLRTVSAMLQFRPRCTEKIRWRKATARWPLVGAGHTPMMNLGAQLAALGGGNPEYSVFQRQFPNASTKINRHMLIHDQSSVFSC